MATEITRNLKLKINSNLTADAKYNLNRIDDLGGTFLVDSTDSLQLRSISKIYLLPNNNSIGGSGDGGFVQAGTASQPLQSMDIFAAELNLSEGPGILDSALTGTKYLRLNYNSTLSGLVENAADRNLNVDLDGADRDLVLAGNLKMSGGNLVLTLTADTEVTLPTSGTLATLANPESFTNKTIDADSNIITNIEDENIKASAGIVYSKLTLTNSIVNADISDAAAIAYSKLNIAGSIVNADVSSSAAIEYSKLNLSASISNSDISPTASIPYSKLDFASSITDADISSSAAIQGSKVVPDFGTQAIESSEALHFYNNGFRLRIQPPNLLIDWNLVLPTTAGTFGQVLTTDGTGVSSWQSIAGTGTVTSIDLAAPSDLFTSSGGPISTAGIITLAKVNQSANRFYAGPSMGPDAAPTFRIIDATDIPTGIPAASIGTGTVDNTEFGYLNNVTSPIQAQLDDKQQVDADLSALASLSTPGLIARTGNGTAATRTLVAGNAAVTITDGDGIAGNPTISLDLSGFDTDDISEGLTNLYFTDERAQDAVASALTDSSSIDFTYTDLSNTISAAVLPGGVNHNALLNYSANEHVDHTSVQIATSATSGLSGGGTIASTRNITVAPHLATSKASPVGADIILIADSAASNALKSVTLSSLNAAIGVSSYKADWLTADGLTKVITHSLGSLDVQVQIYDSTAGDTIEIDSVVRTDSNTITLTASQTPATSWRVMILKV